jgi:hypothetical protein
MQVIAAAEPFETFHDRLLKLCIPWRQLEQLRISRYGRVQAEGESFASYVQSVQDAGLILRISEDESLVVRRIMEGLTSTQRNRFISGSPKHISASAGVGRV